MATDLPCAREVTPLRQAVCSIIKEIVAAHEARHRQRAAVAPPAAPPAEPAAVDPRGR